MTSDKVVSKKICLVATLLFSITSGVYAFASTKDTVINLDSTSPTPTTPFHANYKVSKGRLTLGNIKRQLTQLNDDKYVFSYLSDLSFLILSDKRKESAEITIADSLVEPHRYLYKREGTGSNSETTLSFGEQGNVVDEKLARELDCDKAIHWYDQISYQLQMKLDLASGKDSFEYYLIDDDKREKLYKFVVTGNEKLTVPAGTFDTVKIERIRKNKKRVTQIWLAPELGNLIVRIRQEKEGSEQADAQLTQVTFNKPD